jgi:hypothetical protein
MSFAELDSFLDSEEANFGLTARARQLVSPSHYLVAMNTGTCTGTGTALVSCLENLVP